MTEDDPTLDVARDLRAIVDLCKLLHDQAVHRASHHDMPGGDALVMLAPVASPEAWGNRIETAERLWWESDQDTRPDVGLDEDATWEPPLQTLLFWSEAWRFEHDAVSDLTPTVDREAAWLGNIVGWAWDHEPHWSDFAKDVAAARRRLEAALYAGEREERSAVPCIDCEVDRNGQPIRLLLVRHYADDPSKDRWDCPRCDRRYDEAAYLRAQNVDGERRGTARFVPVKLAAEALGMTPATFRRIATACDIATRSLLVWWPDARDHAKNSRVVTPV
jgi:hypothetical protein